MYFFLQTLISLKDMNVLIGISKCNVVPLLDRIPLLPWWLRRKASAYNVGDLGSIPGSGRSPGKGKVLNAMFIFHICSVLPNIKLPMLHLLISFNT